MQNTILSNFFGDRSGTRVNGTQPLWRPGMPSQAHRCIFLPVVHARNEKQVRAQLYEAYDAGADGAFVINQGGMDAEEVVEVTTRFAHNFRDVPKTFRLGVNLLGVKGTDAIDMMTSVLDGNDPGVTMLWTDNAGSTVDIWDTSQARIARDWDGLYFAGAAFKYQPAVPFAALGKVARKVAQYAEVVTTSGPGTGEPADLKRLAEMAAALRDEPVAEQAWRRLYAALDNHTGAFFPGVPLAVASGVNAENVAAQKAVGVRVFIVASSIERKFGEFDPDKLRELLEVIHAPVSAAA